MEECVADVLWCVLILPDLSQNLELTCHRCSGCDEGDGAAGSVELSG